MTRMISVIALAAASLVATAAPASAQSVPDQRRFDEAQRRYDSELANYRAEVNRYVATARRGGGGYSNQGYDPRYGDPQDNAYYDPTRDYRSGNYQERVLSSNDRVYAGTDGQYYCKRSDGTTGLIVGAAGGGVLGNVIDGGRSRTVGTLLGAAIGAVAGRAVEQNQSQVRCR